MPGITFQQALALKVTGHAVGNGVRELCEFSARRRLEPAKPQPAPIGAADVHTIEKQHMEMDI